MAAPLAVTLVQYRNQAGFSCTISTRRLQHHQNQWLRQLSLADLQLLVNGAWPECINCPGYCHSSQDRGEQHPPQHEWKADTGMVHCYKCQKVLLDLHAAECSLHLWRSEQRSTPAAVQHPPQQPAAVQHPPQQPVVTQLPQHHQQQQPQPRPEPEGFNADQCRLHEIRQAMQRQKQQREEMLQHNQQAGSSRAAKCAEQYVMRRKVQKPKRGDPLARPISSTVQYMHQRLGMPAAAATISARQQRTYPVDTEPPAAAQQQPLAGAASTSANTAAAEAAMPSNDNITEQQQGQQNVTKA